METLLIEIYLFVCRVYDSLPQTCYQRLSHNCHPKFTGRELITIRSFAHLEGCFEKKKMHRLIEKSWREWFPRLPSYQTFALRLNGQGPDFQTLGDSLTEALAAFGRPGSLRAPLRIIFVTLSQSITETKLGYKYN